LVGSISLSETFNLIPPEHQEQCINMINNNIVVSQPKYLCMAGVNFEKADTQTRAKFHLTDEAYSSLLTWLSANGHKDIFVLSTCNRTEIYGISPDPNNLIDILCRFTEGSAELFKRYAYTKICDDATEHLFRVAAGLNSQIIGDNEIVTQIRMAAEKARNYGCLDVFMERFVNSAIEVSKRIKSETAISNGTTSLSYAVIHYLKQIKTDWSSSKIMVIGLGEIGKATALNIKNYLSNTPYVSNRTNIKASMFAAERNLFSIDYSLMTAFIENADVVITATASTTPIVKAAHFYKNKKTILIDLGIPPNASNDVISAPNIQYVDVDDLSKILEETFEQRRQALPFAEKIIKEQLQKLYDWHVKRRHAGLLKNIKLHLVEIENEGANKETIDRRFRKFAGEVHKTNTGCEVIETAYNILMVEPSVN